MAKTSKGHIQQLPSGSFRVKVYAGTDPVTGKARLLRQTCPDEAAAHAALSRMLVEAGGGRFPDQQATLGQALGKYLEGAPGLRPPHHRAGARRGQDPQARRRLARRAVYRAEEVLPAVRKAAPDRALWRR